MKKFKFNYSILFQRSCGDLFFKIKDILEKGVPEENLCLLK
jgi:hypothetical protein